MQPSPSTAVSRGLAPRVHLLRKKCSHEVMDCRVKPGNDGGEVVPGPAAPYNRTARRDAMLTRRGFVAGSTAALLGGTLPSGAQESQKESPKPRVRVIDVHAHWYPP